MLAEAIEYVVEYTALDTAFASCLAYTLQLFFLCQSTSHAITPLAFCGSTTV